MRCEGLHVLAPWEVVTELLGNQKKENADTHKPKVAPSDEEMSPYSRQFNLS